MDTTPDATGTAKRRSLSFGSLDDATAEVDRLLASGYRRAGRWTLGQNLDHLSGLLEGSLDGFPPFPLPLRPVMFLARPIFRRGILKAARTGSMPAGLPTAPYLQPGKGELVAPSAEPAAATDADRAAADRFRRAAGRVRDHAGEFAPSPVAGRLSGDQWRGVHAVHAAHHLGFLVPAGD